MKNEFKNKVVWIIGASSGIGAELAIQLNKLGAFVILSARKHKELLAVQSSLEFPSESMVVEMDLEQSELFESLAQKIVDKKGKIDFLFNNGGVSQRGNARDTSIAIDRRIMEINYFGNIALTKAVLPYMITKKSGHIVVISSIAGKFGFFLRSAYSASKHALQGFYESLLLEEAEHNINVTIAYPGKINTPISMSALTADGKANGKMDHNQATGMPVEVCVKKILVAVSKKKKSVLVGNKEILPVYIKRFSPKLFWKIIKNQSPT
ncbi:SDR family oxidoreductase [Crocinitomix catalasitica]|uniref:SDR family oxidoreductase n=1 Tax=Crocinitomix catalasitica TaxID=184607 RepID=UPI000486CFF2|nr:SDR family oxidoreductase [Crocinitomix catalasitica]